MPAWIHDRANRMKADLQKQYGKKKGEQVAFAIATQQAHRLGKSPKTFKSKVTGKKETFGTPQARSEAKAKFDKPLKEYKKTASAASQRAVNTLKRTLLSGTVGGLGGGGIAAARAEEGDRLRAALKGGAVGAGLGIGSSALLTAGSVGETMRRAAKASGKKVSQVVAKDVRKLPTSAAVGPARLYESAPVIGGVVGGSVGAAQSVKRKKKTASEAAGMIARAALRRGATGGAVGGIGGAGIAALRAEEGSRLRAALKGGAVGAGIGAAGGAISGAIPTAMALRRMGQAGGLARVANTGDIVTVGDKLLYQTGPTSSGVIGAAVGGSQKVKPAKNKKKTAQEEPVAPTGKAAAKESWWERQKKLNEFNRQRRRNYVRGNSASYDIAKGDPIGTREAKQRKRWPRLSEWTMGPEQKKEAMVVPPLVRDLALDILEKEAKLNLKAVGQGLKKGVQKVVGQAPGKYNPLDPGTGLKGAIGRLTTPM
jgi:hypothetical protein